MVRPVSFGMSFQAIANSISLRAGKIMEWWLEMVSVCFLPRNFLIKQHWKKSNNDKLIHKSKKSQFEEIPLDILWDMTSDR